MTVAVPLPKGFDAADAVKIGLAATDIRNRLRVQSARFKPKPKQPTFPFFGVPVAQADNPLLLAVERYIAAVHNRETVQHAIITGVASGKTEQIIKAIVQAIKDGLTGVIFVPQHALSADFVNRINFLAGSTVCRVWYGVEQTDQSAPGQTMCRQLIDAKAWQAAGKDLSTLCKVCPFKPIEGKKAGDCCGYQLQKMDKTPRIWVLPSNMSEHDKPSNISPPSFVIFDEAPTQALLAGLDSDYLITPAELSEERIFQLRKGDTNLEMFAVMRDVLVRTRGAMVDSGVGPFHRDQWAGLNVERLRDMANLEWTLAPNLSNPTTADLGSEVFRGLCEQAAKTLAVIKKRWRFWTLLADFIESGEIESPNLTATPELKISMAWKSPIHDDWKKAPTLLLDATLNQEITRQWFPRLEVTANIKLEAPHCTRTQVVDIPFAARQWNPNPDAANFTTQKNNADKMAHHLEVKAAQYRGQGADGIDILFIGQKRLVDYLKETHGARLGGRVALEHQNNLRGVDTYKGVRCLILTGRLEPPPRVTERIAGVIFGKLPEAIQPGEDGKIWYPEVEQHLRMTNGPAVAVKNRIHPDPNVQAVLEQIRNAELLQCEGRGRANRRTAENPLEVLILTNIALDLTIDQTIGHKELLAAGTGFQLMLARGIVPEQWGETARVLGLTDGDATRKWFGRHPDEATTLRDFLSGANSGHSPIETLIGKCPTFDDWHRYPVRCGDSRKRAWVWIKGDDPAQTILDYLGADYTLLVAAVPVAAPVAAAVPPEPAALPELPPEPINDDVAASPANNPVAQPIVMATVTAYCSMTWKTVPI